MFLSGINYWSIIAASIAAFILGFIWYSPWLFGKIWAKEMNMTAEEEKKSMTKTYSIWFLFSLLTSIACAALLHSLFIVSFGQILFLAIIVWAGFVLATKITDVLFGKTSWKLFLVNVGYDLLAIILIFVVVSFFK